MKKFKKVIVCGGRNYADTDRLFAVLNTLVHKEGSIYVIHGGAPGADERAGGWAAQYGVPCAIVPANWAFYGNRGGPTSQSKKRKREMRTSDAGGGEWVTRKNSYS